MRPRRLPARPRRDRRAGRGRPHGRPGLRARRHPDPRRRPRTAASGCCSRRPSTAGSTSSVRLPARPGRARGRLGAARRSSDDGPPGVHRAAPTTRSSSPPRSRPGPAARCSSSAPSTAPTGWPSSSASAGVEAAAIHGNLSQSAAAAGARRVHRRAARGCWSPPTSPPAGIHVDDVDLVVHFDPPNDHKDYLHRSGRTARAGATGTVVAFAEPAQSRTMIQLHRSADISATTVAVHRRARGRAGDRRVR